MRIFASGFFMSEFPPSPRASRVDRFECFRKFAIFASQDTGGKFATSINDTVGKFCYQFSSVVDTGGNLQIMGKISGY
jgi:hypothetical protein